VTNTEYVEHFKALVCVVETYGGAYGQEPGLVATELVAQGVRPEDIDLADRVAIIKAEEVCRECYLSCMLIRGADNGRYFQLKVDLSNNMTKGADSYRISRRKSGNWRLVLKQDHSSKYTWEIMRTLAVSYICL
jgi:hypothetical protein